MKLVGHELVKRLLGLRRWNTSRSGPDFLQLAYLDLDGKVTVTLRLYQETKDLLEKGAIESRASSLSEYAERAILAQLKRDGIK